MPPKFHVTHISLVAWVHYFQHAWLQWWLALCPLSYTKLYLYLHLHLPSSLLLLFSHCCSFLPSGLCHTLHALLHKHQTHRRPRSRKTGIKKKLGPQIYFHCYISSVWLNVYSESYCTTVKQSSTSTSFYHFIHFVFPAAIGFSCSVASINHYWHSSIAAYLTLL